MRFLGHLDVMRYFQKLLRRAKIPMRYSEGFHPHQILSFAQPLGLGLASEAEYADIEITEPVASEEALRRLREASAEGIDIVSFCRLPDDAKGAMSIVAGADYRVRFTGRFLERAASGADGPFTLADWDGFLASEKIVTVKKTKKGEAELDIRPFIYESRAESADTVFLRLAAGSETNIKPELVIGAFLGPRDLEITPGDLFITRLELYAAGPDGGLVSLESFGEEIAGEAGGTAAGA